MKGTKTRRNEITKKARKHLINSKLFLATAVIVTAVAVVGFTHLLSKGIPVYAQSPSTIIFDFDAGSPPPSLYQNTPFNYFTSDGVTAHFSSPSDILAPAFSIQDTVPLGYNLSMFSGQWLYDNQLPRDYLDIKFNAHLYSINVTFAIVEQHGGPGTVPSYINLTAYTDSIGNQIGWTWAQGETASEQNTQGTLSFNSGNQPFNLVRIGIPPNQPPFNPTDFLVDNIAITATREHDVSVMNVVPAKTIIDKGYTGNVTVTVQNQGGFAENFSVTVYANTTQIATLNFVLTNGIAQARTSAWNTTGFAYGNYTLTAMADVLLGEIDTADNNYTSSIPVHVGVPGDISGPTQGVYDKIVNMRDINYSILLFNTTPSTPKWNPNADVNSDQVVNMRDIQIAILNFNQRE